MAVADFVALLALINGALINGRKLAVTLDGEELTKEEVLQKLDSTALRLAILRDND